MTLIDESVWCFLLMLNIPPSEVQKIIEIILFSLSGMGMYYLAFTIYKKQIVAFVASIFWMFNFFRVFQVMWLLIDKALALMPFLLATFLNVQRNVLRGKSTFKQIVYFSIVFTVFNSVVSNPPYSLAIVLFMLFIFAGYLFLARGLKLKLIKVNILLFTITVLLSVWWLIPAYLSFFQTKPGIIIGKLNLDTYAGNVNLISIFQLQTSKSWETGNAWAFNLEAYDFYNHIRPLLFIPIILSFLNLLIARNKKDIYLATATLPLLFFSKGIHPPLEQASIFLWTNTPMRYVINAGDAFTQPLLICISLLIGSLTNKIIGKPIHVELKIPLTSKIKKLKGSVRYLGVLIIIVMLIVLAFPMLTGKLFPEHMYNVHAKIPNYWYEATGYINEKSGDFTVLPLPICSEASYHLEWYEWDSLGRPLLTKNFVRSLIRHSVIDFQISYYRYKEYNDKISELLKSIEEKDRETFLILLRLLNVKYILFRNDLLMDGEQYKEEIKDFLQSVPYLKSERSFGKLDIYKVLDEYFSPRIYAIDFQEVDVVARDTSDKGIDGAIHGALPTKFGTALDFNGSEYVLIPHTLDLNITEKVTFESWQKITSFANSPTIIAKMNDERLALWHIAAYHPNSIAFGLRINGVWDAVIGGNIEENKWYHFAGVYDGTEMRIYINGELVATKSRSGLIDTSSQDLFIGSFGGTEHFFKGDIREVRIYNRALSQVEIQSNMNGKVIRAGLVGEWKLKFPLTITHPVSYIRANPVKYIIHINSDTTVNLIFSDNYDPNWKAYLGEIGWLEALSTTPIDINRHFIANGYANGWLLEPGNYTLTMFFLPQSFFYLGILVSALTLILCSLYIAFSWVSKQTLRKRTL
jgi:hypothetical protein